MNVDPHGKLKGVHPDLVKVIETAGTLYGAQPFEVDYGLRTLAEEAEAVRSGHSTTMHSRHLPNREGYGCAVDVCVPSNDPKVEFAQGHEAYVFGGIMRVIFDAALKVGVPVEFGEDWATFKDWGHVQLPWSKYP